MSERPDPPDPELVAVLREVAADPRSILLRVPRANALRAFQEHATPVHHTATGLTSAERHLLRSHRHELAHLLRQACIVKLATDASSRDRFIPFGTSHTAPERIDQQEWKLETNRIVGIPALLADSSSSELLSRCASRGIEMADLTQLAASWWRLTPTFGPRVVLTLHHANSGDLRKASEMTENLIGRAKGATDLAVAWANAGHVQDRLGHAAASMQCFDTALHFEPDLISARICRFIVGLLSGILKKVEEDAAYLDELEENRQQDLEAQCSGLRNLKRRGGLPHPLSQNALRLRERMGSSSGRLFDAMS